MFYVWQGVRTGDGGDALARWFFWSLVGLAIDYPGSRGRFPSVSFMRYSQSQ